MTSATSVPWKCAPEQASLQMHVYGTEFQKHKLTEKWMNVECKRIIRTTVINPTMRFHSDASDEVSTHSGLH